MSCSGRDMQNVWHCMMDQCLSHCWMFTLHCKCTMEQCLGQCWMFTLYDGTVPRSVLNACNWSASVGTECLHYAMEQCLASAECWHCMMELCLASNAYFAQWNIVSVTAAYLLYIINIWQNSASGSAECLHCMMEQCLGQCWMIVKYNGTVPWSVLNVYIVWRNNASVSAECLHCTMEQCWMFTLYDGTVPRSVLNAYIVQWNSALVSAEWKESVSHGRNEYFYMLARWLLIHNTDNCEQKEMKLFIELQICYCGIKQSTLSVQ